MSARRWCVVVAALAVAVAQDREALRCYAAKYPDLYAEFCIGGIEHCSMSKLRKHLRQVGRGEGRSAGCDDIPAFAAAMLRPVALGADQPPAGDGRPPPAWTAFCLASPSSERRAPRMDAAAFDGAVAAHFASYGAGIARLASELTGADSGDECRLGDASGELVTSPMVHGLRFCGEDWPCPASATTMVGMARLASLAAILRIVEDDGVAGDVAELGAWRCGASVFARRVLDALGGGARTVRAFDAFGALGYGRTEGLMATDYRAAATTLRAHDATAVVLHAGPFSDTVPKFRATDRPVALLRVDANFYDSFMHA